MAEEIDRSLRQRLELCICRRGMSNGRHILWTRLARDWVSLNFECSQEDVLDLICKHLKFGGRVKKIVEQRDNWKYEFDYHYDYVIEIEEKPVYIETRITMDSDEINILIANVHEARS